MAGMLTDLTASAHRKLLRFCTSLRLVSLVAYIHTRVAQAISISA
jgi:hypothetical protein